MKNLILFILFLSFGFSAFAKNLGHRAAGGKKEFFKHLPENSITAMKAALEGIDGSEALQFNRSFLYLEFDVQETYDGKIVVFHDKTLKRMMPKKGLNLAVYKRLLKNKEVRSRMSLLERLFNRLKVQHLTLEQLREFRLLAMEGEIIPTLEEMLESAKSFGIRKPVAVEIKYLRSEAVKQEVIDIVSAFKKSINSIDIIFEKEYDMEDRAIMFSSEKKFKKNYGLNWCEKVKGAGLKYFKTKEHYKLCL